VYARGEGGLMGLLVHPDFAQTRRFTTCQTHQEGGRPEDLTSYISRNLPCPTLAG